MVGGVPSRSRRGGGRPPPALGGRSAPGTAPRRAGTEPAAAAGWCHPHFPGRDSQQPRFETRDEAERARFGLYGLHQRAAEAVTIRAWATDQLQGHGQERHVVVCGDNDTPQAATTRVLLGPPGSQLGTGGFNQPDLGDGNRLWNLAPRMPAGDPVTGEGAANWSRINNGVRELIDHILVSHLLVHALESTESLPLEGIKSVTADPRSLADMEAPSDHRPVIARSTSSGHRAGRGGPQRPRRAVGGGGEANDPAGHGGSSEMWQGMR
jgi:hypothetical protein